MRSSKFLPFLLPSILSSILLPTLCTSAAISDNTPLAGDNPTHNLTNPNAKFACAPNPGRRVLVFPHMENCAGALRAFPSDAKEAVFHIGGPDDGYRLPVVQRYADCEVLVETAELAADNPVSSWVEIGLAAMELNTVCFTAYGGKIGGTTYCGGGNGVKISLRGAGRRMSDEGNAAAEA